MTVNLGPSHPAMHGTVRMTVTLDGETIVQVDLGDRLPAPRVRQERARTPPGTRCFPYTDRLNYVSPILNNVGYIMAVEKLIGLKIHRARRVPPRARRRDLPHLRSPHLRRRDRAGAGRVHRRSSTASKRASCSGTASPSSAARASPSRCDAHRRRRHRPAAPAGTQKLRDILARATELTRRDRHAAHAQPHLRRSHPRTSASSPRDDAIDCGLHRPLPARLRACTTTCARRTRTSVYDRIDFDIPLGTNGDNYDRYRAAAGGDAPVAPDHPPVPRADAARADHHRRLALRAPAQEARSTAPSRA